MSTDSLAQPLRLRRGGVLPNRIAKAAMSEALGDDQCAPTDCLYRLYERLGRGGAGMLITGNVITDRILKGEVTEAKPVEVRVGVRLFDDMLQTAWYRRQLERMGEGLEPDESLSRFGTITANLTEMYRSQIRAMLRRDPRRRISAAHG